MPATLLSFRLPAILICVITSSLFVVACQTEPEAPMTTTPLKSNDTKIDTAEKLVIYQVFTRLFGNTNTTNKPWGTIEENGSGKFSDFSEKALDEISAE